MYQQPVQQEPVYQAPVQQPVYQPEPAYTPEPAYQPQPVQQAAPPAYTPSPSYAPTPTKTVSDFDKKAGKLIPITFILTLALLAISIILPLTTDIFEIPFMSFAMDMSGGGDEVDEAKDEMKDSIELAEDTYKRLEDDMSSDQKDAAEKFLDSAEKVSDNFSLLNLRSFVSVAEDVSDELEDYDDMTGVNEDLETIQSAMNIVIVAVIAIFALPLIFTLLGGLCKSKALTITALVFMVFAQVLLCGWPWVILSLVIYIFQAVLCGKAKKARLAAI